MKTWKTLRSSLLTWEVSFILVVTLLMIALHSLSIRFVELVDLKAWDLHFWHRGPAPITGKVAFVAVDEESVNRDGRWPWPRRQIARLLKAIEGHGAKVIGLDMGFFEPDLKLRQEAILELRDRFRGDSRYPDLASELEAISRKEDDDAILADTIQNLRIPLVLGHFFYFDAKAFFPEPPPEELLDKAKFRRIVMREKPSSGNLLEAVGIETNIPVVENATDYAGSFNVFPDLDGSVRWMPLVIRYKDLLFPSMALQMLTAAFPKQQLSVEVDDRGIKTIMLGDTLIPTNDKGKILLHYYGPPYSFRNFSATALLHGELPPDSLKDYLVVLGNTTMGLFDMRPTPVSSIFPGVELHCVVLENVLQQHFLQRSERTTMRYDLAMILGLAGLLVVLQFFLRGLTLSAAVLLLTGGYLWLTHLAFLHVGLWLNHIYPPLNLIVGFVGISAYRYRKEEREKNKVRQTFSLYVHRSVVAEMLAHPERLRLGGEKKELTVLFSDIRGFTTLSEKMPAEELVPQLNEYLTRMTQIVFDHQGTLDKYIGDAIMAIFGAPLSQEDHARRACSTALDMAKALASLQESWRERGKPVLNIGIGVNTGLMMVGNMGSERRFDYTVVGDNVNLASRLEGLTKKYGVTIVVSEPTWKAAGEWFTGRELDIVRVVGKQTPVCIYELLGYKEEEASFHAPLEIYQKALLEFRDRNWEKALELFEKVEEWWPADPPSRTYQERCRSLLKELPGKNWSYVTVLDQK